MRNRSITVAAAGLLLTGVLLTFAGHARAEDDRPDPDEIVDRYDKNDDGKLDPSELKAARAERRAKAMKEADLDGDGKVTAEERQKIAKQHFLDRFDANDDGVVDESEKEAARKAARERQQKALEKYDANKDGQLDKAEREKARSEGVFVRKRKGPHPGGPRPQAGQGQGQGKGQGPPK
jgi:Ca2+-binding EF-hand superfamily protein